MRFLTGISVLLIFLFVVHVVLTVPYHYAVWGSVAAAFLAAAWGGSRAIKGDRTALVAVCSHPVVVLSFAVALLALFTTRFQYLPYLGDEFSNWIGWAVQLVATDSYKVNVPVISYTPGWALLMAVPGGISGNFDVNQIGAISFILHVGLLGAVYDAVLAVSGRGDAATPVMRRLAAWGVVLTLLLVEASWKLLPTNLLIERPQIIFLIAPFVAFSVAQIMDQGRLNLGLMAGTWIAAGYLIKVAMLVAVPFLAVLACVAHFWLPTGASWVPVPQRLVRAAVKGALCMLPFLVVYLLWSLQSLPSHCMGQPIDTLTSEGLAMLTGDKARELAVRLSHVLGVYLADYKLPVTVLAIIGLVSGLANRRTAVISAAVVGFFCVYGAALFWMYLTCFAGYEYETLISHPRHIRIALRVVHVIGLLLLMYSAWRALPRAWPAARLVLNGRRGVVVFAAMVMLLGGWQLRAVHLSLQENATRVSQGVNYHEVVQRVFDETPLVRALLPADKSRLAKVMLIDQGGITQYAKAAEFARHGATRGGPAQHFDLTYTFSVGEKQINAWMREMTTTEYRDLLLSHDLLWPFVVDDWALDVLSGLVNDSACLQDVTRRFLVPDGKGGLVCVGDRN